MKKLIKLSMIIPVVFIIGITLDIIGFRKEDEKLALAGSYILGIGLTVTFFVVIVIGLIMFMTGKLANTDSEGTKGDGNESESEREREQRELKQINTSKRYENRANETEYMARHASNIYKNSTTKEKIFGWIFFGLLMSDFLLIIVFAYLGIIVGAIICGAIFVGTILISGIIKKIQENRSMNAKVYTKSKTREILSGEVKSCNLSSSTSVGSGHDPYPTSRIIKVVYMVKITAGGVDYTAYSKTFYETGDKVMIAVLSGHSAAIVEEDEIKEQESLLR